MLGKNVSTRLRILIDVCVVIVVLSGALTAYLFYDRITTSREKQKDTTSAIRVVLCFFQAENQTDLTRSQARRDRATRLTTEALAKINEKPCPTKKKKPGGTP